VLKWPGRQDDYPYPYSVEINNEWNCISTPIFLHAVYRDNYLCRWYESDTWRNGRQGADVAVTESSLNPLVPEIRASLKTWLKLLPDCELQFM
jgi:hypothetical protein